MYGEPTWYSNVSIACRHSVCRRGDMLLRNKRFGYLVDANRGHAKRIWDELVPLIKPTPSV